MMASRLRGARTPAASDERARRHETLAARRPYQPRGDNASDAAASRCADHPRGGRGDDMSSLRARAAIEPPIAQPPSGFAIEEPRLPTISRHHHRGAQPLAVSATAHSAATRPMPCRREDTAQAARRSATSGSSRTFDADASATIVICRDGVPHGVAGKANTTAARARDGARTNARLLSAEEANHSVAANMLRRYAKCAEIRSRSVRRRTSKWSTCRKPLPEERQSTRLNKHRFCRRLDATRAGDISRDGVILPAALMSAYLGAYARHRASAGVVSFALKMSICRREKCYESS